MADIPPDVRGTLTEIGLQSGQIAALVRYADILDRWRSRINLIGPTDLFGVWRRHILDSVQLWPHLEDPKAPILDLGSGAGLPGLILAALGASDVTLIDSDQRKAVFLREAARHIGVDVNVLAARFNEGLRPTAGRYSCITGRAVAPLSRLADTLRQASTKGGYALLHKGQSYDSELTDLEKSWKMHYRVIPSITDPHGVIIKIWGLEPNDAET